jgi:hypothetical protein
MTWLVGSAKFEKKQKLVYVPPFTEKYPLEWQCDWQQWRRQMIGVPIAASTSNLCQPAQRLEVAGHRYPTV